MHAIREARLETHILASSLTLIASLLALLMLLWHISSTHLVNDYCMPEDWTREFLQMQFGGAKGAIWALLFIVIPMNCVHAMLALDYYHGLRFERGRVEADTTPGAVRAQLSKAYTGRSSSSPTSMSAHHQRTFTNTSSIQRPAESSSVPLASTLPQTYHPLFSPFFTARERFLLHSLYEITIISLLALHISDFFASIPANLDNCAYEYESICSAIVTDPSGTNILPREKCIRINIDIHVSGGFDIALCSVLLGLHGWCLGYRIYEWFVFGEEEGGMTTERGVEAVSKDSKAPKNTSELADSPYPIASNRRFYGHENVDITSHPLERSPPHRNIKNVNADGISSAVDEERRTGMDMGVRYRNWSDERQKRRSRTRSGRRASRSSSAESYAESLSEALLECLVP